MTVSPRKKPGAKKPATPPPAKNTKAGGGRARPRAVKKPSARKKRSKKAGPGFRIPLFTAFLAGLLMAGVCFWGINRASEMRGGQSPVPAAAEKAAPKKAAPKPANRADSLPRISGNASPAPETAVKRGALPPDLDPDGAVAGALLDLQSLPFEESLAAPLEERIRQVDYALMQAAWICKLPSASVRVVTVEDRARQGEPYHVQTLEVLPGRTPDAYRRALNESLKAWAEGAALHAASPTRWVISVNGTDTHTLVLHPGRTTFPREQAAPPRDIWTPPPQIRAPNAPARMVIVMDDLGAGMGPVRKLLDLPYLVTMAFWPHSPSAREGAEAAHRAGREVIIHQPMEPLGYPRVKPGPGVLLMGMGEAAITAELEKSFARVPHAVGLNNHMGSRFTQSREGTRAVVQVLAARGMLVLDSVTHSRSVFFDEGRRAGIAHLKRNVFLDNTDSRKAVLAALRQAERIALLTGQSIAIGHPHAETLAALKEWAGQRNREVTLVRLGDLARR